MNNRSAFTAIAILILVAGLIGVALSVAGGRVRHADPEHTPAAPVNWGTAPTGIKGVSFQGIVLPTAKEGPRSQIGAAVGGFDQSPVGAALAAIHATARMSIATDAQWPLVVQQMIAPGPARDEWAIARAQISITAAILGEAPKIIGYRVTKFTNDSSEIDIYTLQSDLSVTRNIANVVWQYSDWRLRLPDQPRAELVSVVPAVPVDAVLIGLK